MSENKVKRIVEQLKGIYERAEIYQGNYAELDTKENGIIRAIGRLDNPRVSDIARELRISMSTASWCIDRLEKKKYLQRHRTEEDRRAVFLTLTGKGRKIVLQFDEIFERIATALEKKLSVEELEKVVGVLERIELTEI
ncbi:MAG TPA: MarR family transcriptional regulator [bacterium]|nr:MarR family transcriptional regulator [bacterium]